MLTRIGQIAIPAHDVARAVNFYRDTLELKLLFQAPPQLAFFDCGGIRLMVAPTDGVNPENRSSVLYFFVDDIQKVHAVLASRGVKFDETPRMIAKMPDHDLWLAAFRDSEGNLLALMSEVRS